MQNTFTQADMVAFAEKMLAKQDAVLNELSNQLSAMRDLMVDSLHTVERTEAQRAENEGKLIRPTCESTQAITKSLDKLARVEYAVAASRTVRLSSAVSHIDDCIEQYKLGLTTLDEFLNGVTRSNVLHVQAAAEVRTFVATLPVKGE